LVEDNPFVRVATADLLRDSGYAVVEAGSASEVTTMLSSGALVDVVFSDVGLPGAMGGLSLAIWIRNRYPSMPVVLTSGIKAVIPALLEQAAVPFLPKPYSSDELLALISRLLNDAKVIRF
jgi:CheY-like chemotaxis protein